MEDMSDHATTVASGQRFQFGQNWKNYLSVVDKERVDVAVDSIKTSLGVENLNDRTFLDIGSGSGLFSLAAISLGAKAVHSFDFDPQSVETTYALKQQYAPQATQWTIDQGSILDESYVHSLGAHDVVYSWGVLHHTGDMRTALANAARLVASEGYLLISIYNDQGAQSRAWRRIKRTYNQLPPSLHVPFVILVALPLEFRSLTLACLRLQPLSYFRHWSDYRKKRGMSRWHDLVDWVGGYPFEVAKPEDIFEFYRNRGFRLTGLKTCAGGLGCNEYVFARQEDRQFG